MIPEIAVGYARLGYKGALWRGKRTLRALAREEEKHRQCAPARLNRTRSALNRGGDASCEQIVSTHRELLANQSDQLLLLG